MRNLAIAFLALLAAGSAAARPIVAVFPVENRGSPLSPQTLDNLREYLGVLLAAEGTVDVIPSDTIKQRLAAQKSDSYRSCYAESCQIDLGRELAANKSVAVRILGLARKCQVTVQVYDLARSTAESAALAEDACTEAGVKASVERVARIVLARLSAPPPAPAPAATPAPAPAAAPASVPAKAGRLQIDTDPPGAEVRVDGLPAGKAPLSVAASPGRHAVAASLSPGFRPAETVVTVREGTEVVHLKLEKAAGTLVVNSSPPGAMVRLDGVVVGQTPWRSSAIAPGAATIGVSRPGYASAEAVVQVVDGATARFEPALSAEAPVDPARVEAQRPVPATRPVPRLTHGSLVIRGTAGLSFDTSSQSSAKSVNLFLRPTIEGIIGRGFAIGGFLGLSYSHQTDASVVAIGEQVPTVTTNSVSFAFGPRIGGYFVTGPVCPYLFLQFGYELGWSKFDVGGDGKSTVSSRFLLQPGFGVGFLVADGLMLDLGISYQYRYMEGGVHDHSLPLSFGVTGVVPRR